MPNDFPTTLAKSGVLFARVAQYLTTVIGVVLVVGAFLGDFNAVSFSAVGVLALVLFAFVGVVELLVVWPLRRRFGGAG